jgi:hypothetical protein
MVVQAKFISIFHGEDISIIGVDYVIVWDDNRWNIRDGRTGQAKTYSPEFLTSSWDITLGNQDKHGMFAACYKALWNYFRNGTLRKTDGLTRSGIGKMNIGALHDEKSDKGWRGRFNFMGNWLGGNPIVV